MLAVIRHIGGRASVHDITWLMAEMDQDTYLRMECDSAVIKAVPVVFPGEIHALCWMTDDRPQKPSNFSLGGLSAEGGYATGDIVVTGELDPDGKIASLTADQARAIANEIEGRRP